MTTKPLSDMQLAFMRALWAVGEGTVSQVQAELTRSGQTLATTTVSTVLRRLEADGFVDHRRDGRQFVYRATVSQRDLGGNALQRLTQTIYGGDVTAMLAQLLGSASVSADDLEAVQRLIANKAADKERSR